MPRLSHDPLTIVVEPLRKYVQFAVYSRIFPDLANGIRFERVRSLESIANKIESDFTDLGWTDYSEVAQGDSEPEIRIATPIAFTPQFGQATARVTIYGLIASDSPNVSPASARSVISARSNGNRTAVITGPSTSTILERGTVLDAVRAEMLSLRDRLVAASTVTLDIFKIDYNGIIFGGDGMNHQSPQGGVSFQ